MISLNGTAFIMRAPERANPATETAKGEAEMEHAKASEKQQQQQFMILQEQIQQQNQQHQHAISNFPSNFGTHLRPPRPQINNSLVRSHLRSNLNPNSSFLPPNQSNPNLNSHHSRQQQANRVNRIPPANQAELQMAYHDAWLVCHPDFKRPFSSLEDACERLLPYHVVADYEVEEEDRILASDPTGQIMSRSQEWDRTVAAKVAEFTDIFEKQVAAFNTITRKQKNGEFRAEEQLMISQAFLQEERRDLLEARARSGGSSSNV